MKFVTVRVINHNNEMIKKYTGVLKESLKIKEKGTHINFDYYDYSDKKIHFKNISIFASSFFVEISDEKPQNYEDIFKFINENSI